MEKTIEQINEEMSALVLQKRLLEDEALNKTIYDMFETMTKEEVLVKIGEMMAQSPILKLEVRRLLKI